MTKRIGDFSHNNNKKFKTNNKELDELWGDDLDDKDVDDCFLLATQICEQESQSCSQRNNVSILPSYNSFAFKKTSSSTQLDFIIPTSSKQSVTNCQNGFKRTRSFDTPESSQNLEHTVRKLQEECLAKDGEVSILRSQIKELRTNNDKEYCKKQMEWNSKLSAANQQLNSVQSQLDFKNLEIANLKQQVGSMKANSLNQSFNCSQSPYFKKPQAVESVAIKKTNENVKSIQNSKEKMKENYKIRAVLSEEYPLQKIFRHSLFEVCCEEDNYLMNKKISTSRNGLLVNEKVLRLKPQITILSNGQQLDFNYVKSVLVKLINCTRSEIDAVANNSDINKLICTSQQLLQKFYTFLMELDENRINYDNFDQKYTDDKVDDLHLSLFDPNPWCKNELGINLRQCLACAVEVLPYNSYLRGCILDNTPLIFNKSEELEELEAIQIKQFKCVPFIVLIIKLLNKLKESHLCPGLLSATCVLLSKSCLIANINNTCELQILQLSREIILCKPQHRVMMDFLEFLRSASLQGWFINNLCKKAGNSEENETCLLYLICAHLENGLLKMKNFKLAYLTFIEFTLSAVRLNPKWFYYQENKHYDCLCKLVNVIVDMIYQVIKTFHKNLNNEIKCKDYALSKEILIKGITILYIFNYKVYDLLIKYVATFSQYKVITNLLCDLKDELNLDECNYDALEQLNLATEVPSTGVESKKTSLEGIIMW